MTYRRALLLFALTVVAGWAVLAAAVVLLLTAPLASAALATAIRPDRSPAP